MKSVLHQFFQSISAVLFLGFILQLSFISHAQIYFWIVGLIHSSTIFTYFILIQKLLIIAFIFALFFAFIIKHLVISPSFLKTLTNLIYFALGLGLMGFAKLVLGELNPFTLGFMFKNKNIWGEELATDYNIIRIRDYSTMYSSPNGYFYFFILVVNLIGVRAFSKVKKEGDLIETKLPSRAEIKESRIVSRKRRRSIDEHDLTETRRKSVDLDDMTTPIHQVESYPDNPLESTKKFDLFEKEFSVQSPENLSQADSDTTNVKSSSSMVFLEKFEKLKKPSSIISILLRLKENELAIQTKEPQPVLFWMMTYSNFKKLCTLLTIYFAIIFYFSGNAFFTDLMIGFLISKIFIRFYFTVLERLF